MLKIINKKSLLSYTLLAVTMHVHAEELLLWQVPETEGKIPVFYQDAVPSSKAVTYFKPRQTLQILAKKKDWSKVSALDQSGQMAWIPTEKINGITKLSVTLNQDDKAYRCDVRVQDPQGRAVGRWQLGHNADTEKFEKAILEYNKAMCHFFKNVLEEAEALSSDVEKDAKESAIEKAIKKPVGKGN